MEALLSGASEVRLSKTGRSMARLAPQAGRSGSGKPKALMLGAFSPPAVLAIRG